MGETVKDYQKMWLELIDFVEEGLRELGGKLEESQKDTSNSVQNVVDMALVTGGIASLEVVYDEIKELEAREHFDFVQFLEDFLKQH
jgi:hypothetical protein